MADASDLRVKVARRGEHVAERASHLVYLALRANAPRRTGETQRRLSVRRLHGAPTIAYEVEAPTPQARWTDEGTEPHEIRPRRARALVFYWPQVGRTVFLKRVWHPGTRATRWFRQVTEDWPEALRMSSGGTR